MESYRLNVPTKQKPEDDQTSAITHHPLQKDSGIAKNFFNQKMRPQTYFLRTLKKCSDALFVFLNGSVVLRILGIHALLEKTKSKVEYLDKFQLLGMILFAISIIISILVAVFQKTLLRVSLLKIQSVFEKVQSSILRHRMVLRQARYNFLN